VPCVLAYWPDSHLPDSSCVKAIPKLRRINDQFFDTLVDKSNISREEWRDFFNRAGISTHSKILRYARVIGRKDLPAEIDAPKSFDPEWFVGERQYDENIAVVSGVEKGNQKSGETS